MKESNDAARQPTDGFPFSAGNPIALASLMKRLVEDKSPLTDLAGSLTDEPELGSGLDKYMRMYREINIKDHSP